jgi:cation transport regulator ChaC
MRMALAHGTEYTWIFGYGSLIWRPDFPHARRETGYISGFARRFWQASPDHRGTHEYPGRVVTLIHELGAQCWGAAYAIEPAEAEGILAALDHRERAGYERERVDVVIQNGTKTIPALVYHATAANPNFIGPTAASAIVERIRHAEGPSGTNINYVLELAKALRQMGAHDAHVFEIEQLLERT